MKEASIKLALNCRARVVEKVLKNPNLGSEDRNYFEGKLEGYKQAIDLLNEPLESIEIELHIDNK